MLNFGERGYDDVYFDSVECLSSEEESIASEKEYVVDGLLGYELWKNKSWSVQQRRDVFLQKMGFNEFVFRDESSGVNPMVEMIREYSEAVPASFDLSSRVDGEDNPLYSGRKAKGEASFMAGDRNHELSNKQIEAVMEKTLLEERLSFNSDKSKAGYWWKQIIRNRRKVVDTCNGEATKNTNSLKNSVLSRTKVHVKKKTFKEVSALYVGQEVHAHKGVIWTMKFSPDGQYLASGGQDGVVRIWRVTSAAADGKYFSDEDNVDSSRGKGNPVCKRKETSRVRVVIPDEIFQIKESPLQALLGHTGDVLDLAWSNANCLLSSSMDKTVRMWRVGSDECLHVFQHTNYVTSVQFSPSDGNCFISGSIDGKVRIWGLLESRVVDWTDVRDVITALCYQPDGKGFLVGCLGGTCKFYEASGSSLELKGHFKIHGSNKSFGNRITGIQFCQEDPNKVMVTSEGSRLHIFDRTDAVFKYRGLSKSGSQISASFTSNQRHIVSAGEDSRVYIWNYHDQSIRSSGSTKSIRSCEYFHSEGVSTAVPWSGRQKASCGKYLNPCFEAQGPQRPAFKRPESKCFSLMNWFSKDSSLRDSATTWPEEILPLAKSGPEQWQLRHQENHSVEIVSATWGLVILTASLDGIIRTFHNYGLPTRI